MSKEVEQKIDSMSAAFGVSALITLILNTLLAIAKDLYPPLQKMMATLSGHHWITHAIFDIVVFYLLGYIFYSFKIIEKIDTKQFISLLFGSIIVSVTGLIGWFFFI